MKIKFRDQIINCRQVKTTPSHFKLGDIVMGPGGNLLEVKTVQNDCPVWESNTRTKCAVVFETDARVMIPVPGISGTFTVFRKR